MDDLCQFIGIPLKDQIIMNEINKKDRDQYYIQPLNSTIYKLLNYLNHLINYFLTLLDFKWIGQIFYKENMNKITSVINIFTFLAFLYFFLAFLYMNTPHNKEIKKKKKKKKKKCHYIIIVKRRKKRKEKKTYN